MTPAMTSANEPEPEAPRTFTAHRVAFGATDARPRPLLVMMLETNVPWVLKSWTVGSAATKDVLFVRSTRPDRSMC
jgi:hypothetical protein